MATRIKDGIMPYTGGQGIEITNNHVINVLLRELNNLIQVNGDRELYVDLQLPDGIQPSVKKSLFNYRGFLYLKNFNYEM